MKRQKRRFNWKRKDIRKHQFNWWNKISQQIERKNYPVNNRKMRSKTRSLLFDCLTIENNEDVIFPTSKEYLDLSYYYWW